MVKKEKIKKQGEVFTPNYIVEQMLQLSNYYGESILKKNVIDCSCGEGAFLETIVKRYGEEFYRKNGTYIGLKNDLEKYIHGIEIDQQNFEKCIKRLNHFVKSNFNIDSETKNGKSKIKWDILNKDALDVCEKYYGKIDFIFGNPPYVRIHNIPEEEIEKLKNFEFMKCGMSDLYLAFYEMGFKMMTENGKMCYISSNSWLTSVAATKMREYAAERNIISKMADFGHFQPFKGITTYVSITLFDNKGCNSVEIYQASEDGMNLELTSDKLFISGDKYEMHIGNVFIENCNSSEKKFKVKNGVCTLADDVFITENDNLGGTIRCIKATTGKWKNVIYPYNENGEKFTEDYLSQKYPETHEYLESHRGRLEKRSIRNKNDWYAFGRSQAIKDTYFYKISINNIVKEIDDLRLTVSEPGTCVYGGLYISTTEDYSVENEEIFDEMKKSLETKEFLSYVKSLRHYKSGGYYFFSSKELENYLNSYI